MASGSILSTKIPSYKSQYDVYKVSSKRIGKKVSIGGVKVENNKYPILHAILSIFAQSRAHAYGTFKYEKKFTWMFDMEPFNYATLLTWMFERCMLSIGTWFLV